METFSAGALLVLGMLAFINLRNGDLPAWLRSKFLNSAAPKPNGTAASLVDLLNGKLPGLPKTPTSSRTSAGVSASGGGAGLSGATPVAGAGISQPFGGAHKGVDLTFPGARGAPVTSAGAGVVTFAGAAGDYGLRVDVDHGDGWSTRYAHLERITVNTGQEVERGTQLGTLGATGNATGPHLHLELRHNGTLLDPCTVIACGVVTE